MLLGSLLLGEGEAPVFANLRRDIQAVMERDPAAQNVLEVLLTYPGVHALQFYRLAHRLYQWRMFLLARIISHIGRFFTGIEIHPGACIGPGLFIDHGMGVVIGETAEVGENVTIYQGAVLGGTGKEKGKRHPTIGDNVVIAAGAKLLGSFTVGENSKIGASAVVLKEVPPNSTVVGVPGRVVVQDGRRIDPIDLNMTDLPDPVEKTMRRLSERILELEERLRRLEKEQPGTPGFVQEGWAHQVVGGDHHNGHGSAESRHECASRTQDAPINHE